jgi:hypothetical protein
MDGMGRVQGEAVDALKQQGLQLRSGDTIGEEEGNREVELLAVGVLLAAGLGNLWEGNKQK